MKKYILFLSLITMSIAVKAQFDKEPYITKSLSNQSIQNVKVETSGGSITVGGVSPSEAKIEVYVSSNNGLGTLSKDEIQKRLEENYELKISVDGNTLNAIAKQKHDNMDWKRSLSISFKIYVPKNVSTDLSTSGGSINLNDLSGTQKFRTSGGSLHVDNITGKIDGGTSGGSIHLSNCNDDIDLRTSGGSIEAKNCKGKLDLSTSGGSLNLSDLDGTIDASTSGGHIEADNIKGEFTSSTSGGSIRMTNIAATLETSTSGGSINVEISSLGKYVKVSNSGGDINLSLPANKGLDLDLHGNKVKVSPMNNFSGDTDENSINGKLNGGGTQITARAGSGHIYLSFK
ncbi:MAG TPA: hypothetical protein VN958_05085 [Chitinophagaceae bacterium]|nr:hypothetical protein [Chitinophagaceae bacterium]